MDEIHKVGKEQPISLKFSYESTEPLRKDIIRINSDILGLLQNLVAHLNPYFDGPLQGHLNGPKLFTSIAFPDDMPLPINRKLLNQCVNDEHCIRVSELTVLDFNHCPTSFSVD